MAKTRSNADVLKEDAVFFCNFCGKRVELNAKLCPGCKRIFRDVRCPKCNHIGIPKDFLNGCPTCGYLGNKLEEKKRLEEMLLNKRKKMLKIRLPGWYYSFVAVILLVILGLLLIWLIYL